MEMEEKANKIIDDVVIKRKVNAWIETTKRKGKNKICRDMFITSYKDKEFEIGFTLNGKLRARRKISREQKEEIVNYYNLKSMANDTFSNCYSYRTLTSNIRVRHILDSVKPLLLREIEMYKKKLYKELNNGKIS